MRVTDYASVCDAKEGMADWAKQNEAEGRYTTCQASACFANAAISVRIKVGSFKVTAPLCADHAAQAKAANRGV